jgi:predicted O-methyltransferase YrrM
MTSFSQYLSKTKQLNQGLAGFSLLHHRRIFKEWQSQLKSKKFPLDLELPWITIVAKNFIQKYLKEKDRSDVKIFEFGAGGSSLFFLKYANEVISVEHDPKWYELVKETIEKKNIPGWKVYLHEPEKTVSELDFIPEAGNPHHYYTNSEPYKDFLFKNYVTSIDTYPDNYFDIVLVDGRSRASCLYHSKNKVKKGGLLILDNAERHYYLSHNIIDNNEFELKLSVNGALICYDQFTQTNIFQKK